VVYYYLFCFAKIQYTVEKSGRATLIIFEKSKRLEICALGTCTCMCYYFPVIYWFTYLPERVTGGAYSSPRRKFNIELSKHTLLGKTKLNFRRLLSSYLSVEITTTTKYCSQQVSIVYVNL